MLVETDSEPSDGASLTVQDNLFEDISLQFENVALRTCPIIASTDICLIAVSSPSSIPTQNNKNNDKKFYLHYLGQITPLRNI